jgi:prepilin-type N-terminal cleavage/methylation domain-containing protein
MRKNTINDKAGFTILEVLVVTAAIAIIAGIVFASFEGIKEKNRDARRMSDVTQIQKALSLYMIDFKTFPVPSNPFQEVVLTGEDEISLALEASGNIVEVPHDPQHPIRTYRYWTNQNGTDYEIQFCLETTSIKGYANNCENVVKP